jgi:hypothetical protein
MAVGRLAQDAGEEVECETRVSHHVQEQHAECAHGLRTEQGAWRSVEKATADASRLVTWASTSAHERGGSSATRRRSVRLVMLGVAATVGAICLGALLRVG